MSGTKMRVLVISHLYPLMDEPALGIFVERELQDLAEYGLEFDMIIPRPWAPWPLSRVSRWRRYARGNLPRGPREVRTRIVRYPRPPGLWYRKYEGAVIGSRLRGPARSWHRERGYSLVLATTLLPDADAARVIAKELGLPLAAMAIGTDLMVLPELSASLRKRIPEILRDVDLPIGVSQELCRRMKLENPGGAEPLLVYLGRDSSLFRPASDRRRVRRELGLDPDATVAAYVGALVDSKGMADLASVLPELLRRHADLIFVCVGSGDSRETLADAGQRSGRRESVILPGAVPPSEVARYLQAADFFVTPSHSEGMPQSVLEAMNCGLPVVATRVGGIPQAVLDGETGLLVEPRNRSELQAALERMITDTAFRQRAARASLERASSEFNAKVHARRFAEALHCLAG